MQGTIPGTEIAKIAQTSILAMPDSSFVTPSCSLINCTGTISYLPQIVYYDSYDSVMEIIGRIIIDDYVRTGANPGVRITLPNGKKVRKYFLIYANGYTANSSIRLGENIMVEGFGGRTTIDIKTTETISDLDSASRVFFVISPITFLVD